MKRESRCWIIAVVVFLMNLAPGVAKASSEPTWSIIPVEPVKVSVEPFFQNGDDVHVDLQEWLPTTCYREAPVQTQVDFARHEITLQDQAYLESGVLCAMNLSSHMDRTVDLGLLPAGDYEVWVLGTRGDRQKAAEFRISEGSIREE